MLAAQRGYHEVAKVLLEHGAYVALGLSLYGFWGSGVIGLTAF